MLTDIQADVSEFISEGMDTCSNFDDFKDVINGVDLKATLGNTLPFTTSAAAVKTFKVVQFFNTYFKCASAGADETLAKNAYIVIMAKYVIDNGISGCSESYAQYFIRDVMENNKTLVLYSGMLPTGTSFTECLTMATVEQQQSIGIDFNVNTGLLIQP